MANTIEWDEKYSVDIPELDGYQKELFAMFNALIEMKSKKLDAKAATNMITDINDYSKEFFSGKNGFSRNGDIRIWRCMPRPTAGLSKIPSACDGKSLKI